MVIYIIENMNLLLLSLDYANFEETHVLMYVPMKLDLKARCLRSYSIKQLDRTFVCSIQVILTF